MSELERAHTPKWSTGQRSTGKGMEESEETGKKKKKREEGASLIDVFLHHFITV